MAAVRSPSELVEILRSAGDEAEAATDALSEALSSPSEERRLEAARVLLGELQHPGSSARWAAIHLLQSSWWPLDASLFTEVLQATTVLLKEADPHAPEVEATSLLWTQLFRGHERVTQTLQSLLAHDAPAIRAAAASAAGRLGGETMETIPALLALSRSDPADVGLVATSALAALAPLSIRSIGPALVDLIATQPDGRRYLALIGLRAIAEEAQTAGSAPLGNLPGLGHALVVASRSGEAAVRAEAAMLLGLAADAGVAAHEALEALVRDPAPEVGVVAICGLLRQGRIPPARAAELLVPPLVSQGAETSQATVMTLSTLEPSLLAALAEPLREAARQAPVALRTAVEALFLPA